MNTSNQDSKNENLSTFWVGVIFFFFWGGSFLGGTLLSIGMQQWCSETINKDFSYLRLTTILNAFVGIGLLFMIIKNYKLRERNLLGGMSILIVIFLSILLIRLITDSVNSSSILFRYRWTVIPFSLYIPIIFFSIPLNRIRNNVNIALIGCTIAWGIITLFALTLFFTSIISGYSLRSGYRILEHLPFNFLYVSGPLFRRLCYFGGTHLALICIWKSLQSKHKFIIWGSVPCYFIGTVLTYFTASRGVVLAYWLTHLILLLLPNLFKNMKRFLVIMLVIIVTNVFATMYVGYKSPRYSFIGRSSPVITHWVDLMQLNIFSLKQPISIQQHDNSMQQHNDSIQQHIDPMQQHIDPMQQHNDSFLKQNNNNNQIAEKLKQTNQVMSDRPKLIIEGFQKLMKFPFGVSSRIEDGKLKNSTYHNMFINIATFTGIFGGGIFVIIVFIGIRDAYLTIRKTPELTWIALIFIFHVLLGQTGNFIVEVESFFWFSLVALRANIFRFNKK
jgi:hypothetical protein